MAGEILSRIITHPDKAGKEIPNQGVALVVLNLNNQFLLVQPAHPHLEFGQADGIWNIITGTKMPGELVRSTVIRELWEETGHEWNMFKFIDGSYRETNGIYLNAIGYTFKFRCGQIRFLGDPDRDPNELMTSLDGENKQFMWGDWNKLSEYPLERGADLVLEFYGKESGFIL